MACLALSICSARAGVTIYSGNIAGNSTDFNNGVAANGGSIATFTFNDLSVGALDPNAYLGAGLTLNATGSFATIQCGERPADGNNFSDPVSSGEGLHAISNYHGGYSSVGTLTATFASPVLGVGLFTIDLFNPESIGYTADILTLSAFTGPDGTGTLLGTAIAPGYKFQNDYLYFFGILSTASDIHSIILSEDGSESGDAIGLDDLKVATGGIPAIPEPATLWLAGVALLGLGAFRRLRL